MSSSHCSGLTSSDLTSLKSSVTSTDLSTRSGKSILDLPRPVRFRIWAYSGIRSRCPFDLSREPSGIKRHEFRVCNGWCICPPVPISLFCSSRAIHEETLAYLVRMNRFISTGSPKRLLSTLLDLPIRALSCLQYLHISLSHDAYYDLANESRVGTAAYIDWKLLFLFLNRIPPNTLSLSLYCPLASVLVAQRLQKVLSILPVLRDCAIRLGSSLDGSVQTIARTIARTLTGHAEDPGFPLERAPFDIMNLIFRHMNLIQPARPASNINPLYQNGELHIQRGKILGVGKCCGNCVPRMEGECCCIRQGAYSTSCNCIIVPTTMFVLNKNISSEALATFYRENQFVFPADESLSSLRVLQRLSPVSRQHIRFIGFDLRYPDLQGMLSEEDARRDWRRLIYFIDNHLNLPQLFLCIVSNWRNWWYEHDDDDFFSRDPKAVEHEILAPVRHMRGLRRVFLSTVWHDWEEQLLELEMTGEGISHLTAEEALQKLCAYPHDIWNLLRPRDYDWIEA